MTLPTVRSHKHGLHAEVEQLIGALRSGGRWHCALCVGEPSWDRGVDLYVGLGEQGEAKSIKVCSASGCHAYARAPCAVLAPTQ